MELDEFKAAIRDRTRHVRLQCGFSISQISTLLEVGDQAYCKWEYQRPMPLYQVARFTRIFGIDPAIFLSFRAEDRPLVDPAHIKVLRKRIAAYRRPDTAPDEPDDAKEVRARRRRATGKADARLAQRLGQR